MSVLSASSKFGFKPVYSGVSALGQAVSFNALDVTILTVTNAGVLTASQALGGMVVHAGTSGNLTTPLAADLVAAMPGCTVGTAFSLHVRNSGSATSTLVAGTGVTISGTATTATLNCKDWLFVVTDNRLGSEAVTAYSQGTSVF
jgi:hypothetical protein